MIIEPYPSVIMPSGSGSIDISQNDYTFYNYRAYGIKADGSEHKIDLLELIRPAHKQYLYTIFEKEFGLSEDAEKEIKLRGTDWVIARYMRAGASSENRQIFKEQVRKQLGRDYNALVLKKVSVRGDLKTKKWLDEATHEQTQISL